jgi:signal transduction histidine kinase
VVTPPFYRTWWFVTLMTATLVGAAALAYRRRISQLKRRQAEQEAFARQLIQSQERERQRIAAEIHDSLGQTLAIIKNRALLGINATTTLEAAKEQFDLIAAQSTQAIDEAKDISYNLRPYLLDRLGLSKALESMIRKVADASGISFTTDIAALDGLFSPDEEINLYRIAQECLNNIVKHSHASQATVTFRRNQAWIEMKISDNGRGFVETASANDGDQTRRGFGLTGIRERARLFQATPVIHSIPGQGTTLTIRFIPKTKSTNGDKHAD